MPSAIVAGAIRREGEARPIHDAFAIAKHNGDDEGASNCRPGERAWLGWQGYAKQGRTADQLGEMESAEGSQTSVGEACRQRGTGEGRFGESDLDLP